MNETTTYNTKSYLIKRSDINDRFDPEMIIYNFKVNKFKYETVPLKKLLKKAPQYGANESGINRKSFDEPRYIRITDINEFGLLSKEIGVSADRIERKYVLNNNDILFARSGATVGKSYIHKSSSVSYQCFFAGYLIRFIVDETILLPDYLFTYTQLNIYKEWVKAVQRAAGQPNINAEEYKSIPIPLPVIKVQQNIVNIITAAYTKKQKKEAQAQNLLESIDTYLMKELGIALPPKNVSIESRMFRVNFSDVTGSRLDPQFFLPMYSQLGKNIRTKQYENLKNIVHFSNETWNQKDRFTDTFPYIEISEIDLLNGEINNINWLPLDEAPSRAKMVVRENDIIVSTTRPDRGAICLIAKKEDGYIASTGFSILRTLKRDDILKEYLFLVLRTQICLLQIQQRTSGGNYPAITSDDLKNILIPIVSKEKQKKLIEHIRNIQTQIIKLKAEAQSILENAKAEVEKMILG
jgi:type I restriction enzyme, S subunit